MEYYKERSEVFVRIAESLRKEAKKFRTEHGDMMPPAVFLEAAALSIMVTTFQVAPSFEMAEECLLASLKDAKSMAKEMK